MNRNAAFSVVAAALVVLAALAYFFWPKPSVTLPGDAVTASVDPPVQLPPASAASLAEMPASAASAPLLVEPLAADDSSVREALVGLLGKTAVLSLLQTDGFARRVVATVDNLARSQAAPRLWPVVPTAGRFSVDQDQQVAAANAARYAGLIDTVTRQSPAEAAVLYRRLQPQLQAAYEDLGYPGKPFHDRLDQVIAHLLQTPVLTEPAKVALTEVKGSVPSVRPWVRYEYTDPALEALSSGQKIMLRLSPEQQRALKGWLREFRAAIGR